MRAWLLTLVSLVGLAMLAGVGAQAAPPVDRVTAVRIGGEGQATRVVVESDAPLKYHVFVLAAGSYVTPEILGSTRDALFGNIVYDTIMGQLNWPMGATLSLVLLVMLGAVAAIYSRYMGLSRVFKGLGG